MSDLQIYSALTPQAQDKLLADHVNKDFNSMDALIKAEERPKAMSYYRVNEGIRPVRQVIALIIARAQTLLKVKDEYKLNANEIMVVAEQIYDTYPKLTFEDIRICMLTRLQDASIWKIDYPTIMGWLKDYNEKRIKEFERANSQTHETIKSAEGQESFLERDMRNRITTRKSND